MVEPGKPEDVPGLVELGRQMVAESPRWSRLPYSAERVGRTLNSLMASSDGLVLVARRDGVLVGAILAICEANWMSDQPICQELALFVAPHCRGSMTACRLISGMYAWANIKGAAWCEAGVSTGVNVERTAALYRHLGFKQFMVGLEK